MVTTMVVKEKRGRRRYVAFILGSPVSKSDLEEGIRSTGYSQIGVIQCAGGWCILRCEPWLLERLGGIMDRACPGSESRSTSGNLITLRREYPILCTYISRRFTNSNSSLNNSLRPDVICTSDILYNCW